MHATLSHDTHEKKKIPRPTPQQQARTQERIATLVAEGSSAPMVPMEVT
jgi:hypothetical protein